jgi:hypothetical protein
MKIALILFAALLGLGLQAAEAPKISSENISAAEKILGLEFTDKEREMMRGELSNRLNAFEALRKESFPNELFPAIYFRPLPIGFVAEVEERSRIGSHAKV